MCILSSSRLEYEKCSDLWMAKHVWKFLILLDSAANCAKMAEQTELTCGMGDSLGRQYTVSEEDQSPLKITAGP